MTLDLTHEVRDAVHGLIRLTDQDMELVNTSTFQRLRRIRQLAMADLVYPGAMHTRFEHSLGTLHTAQRILDHLDRVHGVPDTDVRVVRLAALLHDIGHGPFSHVSEYLLDKYKDSSIVGDGSTMEKIHEKLTVDVINKVDDISYVLSQDERLRIVEIIRGGRTRDYRRDIVSSSLDADKMDYLLRDAHFAGVRYGSFDIDKVIDVCRKYERGKESFLVVVEEGVFAVEQLVFAKHYMTQQVYAHRVRTITDLMIVRGLNLAIEQGNSDVRRLFAYDGSMEFLENYLRFDDNALMTLVLNKSFPQSSSIFERLRQRRLFKEVVLIPLDERGVPDSITRGQLLNLDTNGTSELERRIAGLVACESWQVIVHKKSIKHPAYQERGRLEPEAIYVLSHDGTPGMMSEFPSLVRPQLPGTERLHIIAPFQPEGGTCQERQAAPAQMEKKIVEAVFEHVGGAG